MIQTMNQNNMVEFTCEHCGKKFYRSPARVKTQFYHFGTKPRFCCNDCKNIHMAELRKQKNGGFVSRCKYENYDLAPLFQWMTEEKQLGFEYSKTVIYTILRCLKHGYTLDDLQEENNLDSIIDHITTNHNSKTYGKYRGCIRNLSWYISVNGENDLIIGGN